MPIQDRKAPLQLYSSHTQIHMKKNKENKTVTADSENPHSIPFSASRMNENVNLIWFKDNTSILIFKNKGVRLKAS